MKVIGFDLDDTLYSHWEYEKVLFDSIANSIQYKFGIDKGKVFAEMQKLFDAKDFERLFDKAVVNSGYELPEGWDEFVKDKLLPFYRNYKPDFTLKTFEWVKPILQKIRNKGYKVILITNGGVTIQKNKIQVLKLLSEFDKIYISDEFNPPMRKPDLKIFETVLNDFNIKPEEMIYVGDSLEKDGACEKLGIKFLLNTDYKKLYEILEIAEL
ncbi:MAG: HAD family hydrolase [Ignavibacteria bacterium]|nr:HAD family hydrolase [Ignavibacteria bacterium]